MSDHRSAASGIRVGPLSFEQARMWLLEQVDPGDPAQHICMGFHLQGRLDRPTLRAAIDGVAARHAALRTRFVQTDDGPRQVVDAPAPVPIGRLDATGPGVALDDWITAFVDAPFDVATEPPWRVALIELGETAHRLIVCMHHIVCDGDWSLGLFIDGVLDAYARISTGAPAAPAPALQYPDFAERQQARWTDTALADQVEWWREALRPPPPVMALTPDHGPREIGRRRAGARVHRPVDGALIAGLEALAAAEGCPVFVAALAITKAVLQRHTAESRVTVGSPVSGRSADVADLIGYFGNPLVLQTAVDPDAGFRTLLADVHRTIRDAGAHPDLPFQKLVEAVQARRVPGQSPLFQVLFVMRDDADHAWRQTRVRARSAGGLRCTPFDVDPSGVPYDLYFSLRDDGAAWTLTVHYAADLYTAETIERLVGHWVALCAAAVATPEVPIGDLPLMSPEEHAALVVEGNATAAPCPADAVSRLFELTAATHPDVPAVIAPGAGGPDVTLSYAALQTQVDALTARLRSLLADGAAAPTVGVCLERSPDLVAAVIATLAAGAICVPLDPSYPADRLAEMSREAGLRILITSPAMLEVQGHVVRACPDTAVLTPEGKASAAVPGEASTPAPDDLAYLLYTSGSSGRPKGVAMPHRALSNLVGWHRRHRRCGPGVRMLQASPISFDLSFHEIFATLCTGGTLVLTPEPVRRNPLQLADFVRQHRIEKLYLPFYALQQLAEASALGEAPAALTDVFTAGERLRVTPSIRAFFERTGARLHNHYGATEIQDVLTWTLPGSPETWPMLPCVGRPIDNLRVYVLDARGQPVPRGVPGEIYIAGHGLARGYWKQPALTATRFVRLPIDAGPLYRTGDRGRFRPDGTLDVLGRVDGLVKIRGHRVEPGEVEAALRAEAGVAACVVVARPGGDGELQLYGFVVHEADGQRPAPDVLRRALGARLPAYMVPAAIAVLEAFPSTASGKVDRKALPTPRPAATSAPTGPLGGTREVIAQAWRAVLGVDRLDPRASFFDLGGTSLALVRVHRALHGHFGDRLTPVTLFRFPTIDGLARHLDGARSTPTVEQPAAPTPAGAGRRDVAIVGMAGRFPGAADVDVFWRNLRDGVDSMRVFDDPTGDPDHVRIGAPLDDIELFDAAVFGLSRRDAAEMDPQHRILLECAWEAFERAGHDPRRFAGRIGVFAGSAQSTYLINNVLHHHGFAADRPLVESDLLELRLKLGNDRSYLTTRISYRLGLEGPSVNVQTACSTSLVAVHLACRSIAAGECEMALAGGISVVVPQRRGYRYEEGMIRSPRGRVRAFDADADGTNFGDGAGLVVLRPLEDALADGDDVIAVIRGSAVTNDGADKMGYSAPGVDGQSRAMVGALQAAEIDPATIGFVEAHGTGTALGDPIEVEALTRAWGATSTGSLEPGTCTLGSVKTNIGHLDEAAGIAGLVKAALALRHRTLPATLHFRAPNPHIDFARSPFVVRGETRPWTTDAVRRAAVNSVGLGGTNAFMVLEEAPPRPPRQPEAMAASLPLLISGHDADSLRAQADRWATWLEAADGVDLGDLRRAAAQRRSHLPARAAVMADDRATLLDGLTALAAGRAHPAVVEGQSADIEDVVFVFPGHGSQWAGMGRALLDESAAFSAVVDQCDTTIESITGWTVRSVLEGAAHGPPLDRVDVVQPVIFVVGVALAAAWKALGIEAAAVVGHSVGELAAAVVAGALSLEDGARIVAARGRLIAGVQRRGAMLAVRQNPATLARRLVAEGRPLTVAVVNGPTSSVVSGDANAIEALAAALAADSVPHGRVDIGFAAHSDHMDGVLDAFAAAIGDLQPAPARIPIYSTVTGGRIDGHALNAAYWRRNVRAPVRFDRALDALASDGHRGFVELGGRPVLASAIAASAEPSPLVVPSLRRGRGGLVGLHRALGALHVGGLTIDWRRVMGRGPAVSLPTYAFRRERLWLEPRPGTDPAGMGLAATGHPLVAARVELTDDSGWVLTGRATPRHARWLGEHRVFDAPIMPGTGLLELALTAGRQVGLPVVAELLLLAPLPLPDAGQLLQVRVGPLERAARPVSIHSRASDDAPWTMHAEGRLTDAAPEPTRRPTAWPPRAGSVDCDALYAAMADGGMTFGPTFRGLTTAWHDGEVLFGRVELPPTGHPEGYAIHPALLDAALHLMAIADGSETTLPFEWSGATIHADGVRRLRVRLERGEDTVWTLTGWADDGRPVITARLRTRPAAADPVGCALQHLYRVDWTPVAPTLSDAPSDWWLIGDGLDLPGWTTAPDVAAVLDAVEAGYTVRRLIIDATRGAPGSTADAALSVANHALETLQAILVQPRLSDVPVVWLTRGAVATGPAEHTSDLAHATLWGLLRTARSEHPDRVLRVVDLPPGAPSPALSSAVAADDEPELAVRPDAIRAPRLVGVGPGDLLTPPSDASAWALDPGDRVGLHGIEARAIELTPGPGEVRVAVRASALNFADVATAMGMVDAPTFGLELAGVITALGDGVDGLAVGDRVMGEGRSALATAALAPAWSLARMPDALDFAAAASLPVAGLTALYGLDDLARLGPGDRVLIHGAAGGVGMAAVQIARHRGAEVFATASTWKWPALRAMGIPADHIAYSRTAEFESAFAPLTGQRGMDVVLAAVTGALREASLRMLRPGGRFIDMGKVDICDADDIRQRHGVEYRAFDAGTLPPAVYADVLRRLMGLVEAGVVEPLPRVVLDLRQARAAFDHMLHARHIGKLILNAPRSLTPDDTVLVTGGTGALGRALAQHLVDGHGVRRLVLTSRRGAEAPGAEALVRRLTEAGAEAVIEACDVTDEAAVAALVARYPIDAVFHLAGELHDGILAGLTPRQMARALRPKVHGAWHLHTATADRDLSAFVMFSSSSGLLGTAGQANYAAACVFLDALAAHRRAAGLPAHSLAWGLWDQSDGGMAAGLSDVDRRRLAADGFEPMRTADGMALLDAALARPDALLAPMVLDRRRLAVHADRSPLWSSLVRSPRPAAERARPKGIASEPPEQRPARARRLVAAATAVVLGAPDAEGLDPSMGFADLGVDSLMAVELRNRLRAEADVDLPSTVVFDHPNIERLARFVVEQVGGSEPAPAPTAEPSPSAGGDAIAIVGLGLRLPGGITDLDGLWTLLADGRDAVRPIPPERFDMAPWYDPAPGTAGKSYVRAAALLDDVAGFDPGLFGMSPHEARRLDPQQRLLLETAWEALERAGLPPDGLAETSTGVYVGISPMDPVVDDGGMYGYTGHQTAFAAGRLAYVLGLQGPALVVDTLCSASLVALHLAVRALRQGECERALVGGAGVFGGPADFVTLSDARALAPDGRSKAFSAAADGYGRGEGVVTLVLERLGAARAAGRPVLAVVRGTAINHDGASSGITVPNGTSQQRVLRAALADAGLVPGDVDAIECHGTGTRLGDPIEVNAIAGVYGEGRDAPLMLGTIKPTLGHLEATAGLAGVVRVLAALAHDVWPETPHARPLNPHIEWDALAVAVPDGATPWTRGSRPRRAGVSSFGMSGTNAHVILEDAPSDPRAQAPRPPEPLPLLLSAHDEAGLAAQAARWAEWLESASARPLHEMARAAATGRAHLPCRAAIVASDTAEAAAALAALTEGDGIVRTSDRRPVFVFPGQGSQWPGMGRALLATAPAFAAAVAEAEAALTPHIGWSLSAVLRGDADAPPLDGPTVVQPALFGMAYGLARLWMAHGVEPRAVVGHSQGEMVAAVVAGILPLDDGARLVALRSRLVQKLGGASAMVSVALPVDDVEARIADAPGVTVAVVNSPGSTAVAGDVRSVESLTRAWTAEGIFCRRIAISYASHSVHVEPILDPLAEIMGDLQPHAARVPMVSTVTGEPVHGAELDATYWCRNLRQPVRFDRAIATLLADGPTAFIEISAHPMLQLPLEAMAEPHGGVAVSSLRRGGGRAEMWRSVSAAWCAGLEIAWDEVLPPARPEPELPTYAFQRRRYWLARTQPADPPVQPAGVQPTAPEPDEDHGPRVESLAVRLAALPDRERLPLARAATAAATAAVLGYHDAETLHPEADLAGLGVDSLMAMDLRNRLRAVSGLELDATVVFDHQTVEGLARHLVALAAGQPPPPATPSAGLPSLPPTLADLCRPAAARPLRLPPWTVRAATPDDVDRLAELEREAYGWIGEDAIAPPSVIADRIDALNAGSVPWFWVLERDATIVGWSVLQPTTVEPKRYGSWAEATDDGRLVGTFDPTGRAVYLVAGGLAEGVGAIGDAVMNLHHLLLFRETGHEALFTCAAMPGFAAAHRESGVSPEGYLARVDAAGLPLDPFIALLTSSWPITPTLRLLRDGYPPDQDSGGHGVSVVWRLDALDGPIAELCERIGRWMTT